MTSCPLKILLSIGALAVLSVGCQATSSQHEVARVEANQTQDTAAARRHTSTAVDKIRAGDLKAAELELRSAIVADAAYGPAHNNLGRVHFEQSRLYQAAWEFQAAAKLMPGAAEPKNNLGLVLERAGRLDDAIRHFDEALEIAPYEAEYLGNAARARISRGDRDDTVRTLLNSIVAGDARNDWKDWAGEQLTRLKQREGVSATTQSTPLP